jgi:hypothetical protein
MSTYVLFPSAPPPPAACVVCEKGCTCTHADTSCGHYGCYGAGPRTCPAAAAAQATYEQRLAATRAQRARLAARRSALVGAAYVPPTELLT